MDAGTDKGQTVMKLCECGHTSDDHLFSKACMALECDCNGFVKSLFATERAKWLKLNVEQAEKIKQLEQLVKHWQYIGTQLEESLGAEDFGAAMLMIEGLWLVEGESKEANRRYDADMARIAAALNLPHNSSLEAIVKACVSYAYTEPTQ